MIYDRRGFLDTVTDHTGTHDFGYCECGKRTSEDFGDTLFPGLVLAYQLDGTTGGAKGRTTGYTLTNGSALEHSVAYSYDAAGRLEGIDTDGAMGVYNFDYDYVANSSLVQDLTVDAPTAATPFSFNRTWMSDRDLVHTVKTKWTTDVASYTYAYDDANQRTSVVQGGSAFADYRVAETHRRFGYNNRGELTSDIGYANGDPGSTASGDLSGRHFVFGYDDIGNRLTSSRTGVSGLEDEYVPDKLNRYISRENNTMAVSGTVSDAAVQVAVRPAGGTYQAAGRKAGYWGHEVIPNNFNGPVKQSVNVIAAWPGGGGGGVDLVTSATAETTVPAAFQVYAYDADGNMLRDGLWVYQWDAENRLTAMFTVGAPAYAASSSPAYPAFAGDPVLSISSPDTSEQALITAAQAVWSSDVPKQRLVFAYDYLGRRVNKTSYTWDGSRWILDENRLFVYEGWNVIQETETVTAKTRTYTWGLDLVGSLNASGGVGALLGIHDTETSKRYLAGYDGNGNLTTPNSKIYFEDSGIGAGRRAPQYSNASRKAGENAFSSAPDEVKVRLCDTFLNESRHEEFYGAQKIPLNYPIYKREFHREYSSVFAIYETAVTVEKPEIERSIIAGFKKGHAISYKNGNGVKYDEENKQIVPYEPIYRGI